ncbi:MAG: hypothetical protein HND52_20575 [Ignavibacteriae bacterium]|nr:hypothetical protein [Ignavibacteriota bacterium]
MKKTLFIILFYFTNMFAHPGWGIAIDSNGTIYFTDIINKTIWKIEEGKNQEAFIKNVWSHSILIDKNDMLYFENEEFEMGNGWISLKKVSETGNVAYVISPTKYGEGFNSPVFTMDDDQNIYFAIRDTIFKKDSSGTVNKFISDGISSPHYLTYLANGFIYLVDLEGIKRISTDGNLESAALNLTIDDPKDNPYPDDDREVFNRIYGITIDDKNNLYYAYSGNSRVFMIDTSGNKSEIYYSKGPWYPYGLAWYNEKLFVLEEGHAENKGPEALRITIVQPNGNYKRLKQIGELSK